MEPQVELLDLICTAVKNSCEIDLTLEGTPADGGVSAELSPGYTDSLYYSKKAIRIIPILFLSKNKDQRECLRRLSKICNYLQALKIYPQGSSFTWLDAETATEPNRVGRQEDGQWIYSAVVNMKIYF